MEVVLICFIVEFPILDDTWYTSAYTLSICCKWKCSVRNKWDRQTFRRQVCRIFSE